jgi:probable selenium-dependent hydroxylase accessory protein YqeC
MEPPAERFRHEVPSWFLPGAVYTFVGAGGKSTAMMRVARMLADAGLKVRMTTTTRVGTDEFAWCPVCIVRDAGRLRRAMEQDDSLLLLVGGMLVEHRKYSGIDPRLIDEVRPGADTVILVEGDGSRRLPMKVPREGEPVIPSSTRAVLALMGASALAEPVDENRFYNSEGALALMRKTGGRFEPQDAALLASHQDGCRKGVLPGMALRTLLNQADLEPKQAIAREALKLMKKSGIDAALTSFRKGELYGTTAD